MEFKPVEAEDRDIISTYMRQMNSRSCEMAFATVYLWNKFYHSYYTICEEMLIIKVGESNSSFCFPIGKGDPKKAIMALDAYCKEEGMKLKFHCVSKETGEYLEDHFPGKFEVSFNRDYAEYIYDRESLVGLRGKKYHGKKNHINKFNKTYEWVYEPVTKDNLDECLGMLECWMEQNCRGDEGKTEEALVCKEALRKSEFLGLKAGLIRADGNVVAFSVGEAVSDDTFVCHFEKAYNDVPGAYTIINQQFALHEAEGYQYINREDDVGNPGLRKAKLSYHPVILLEKGKAVLKEEL